MKKNLNPISISVSLSIDPFYENEQLFSTEIDFCDSIYIPKVLNEFEKWLKDVIKKSDGNFSLDYADLVLSSDQGVGSEYVELHNEVRISSIGGKKSLFPWIIIQIEKYKRLLDDFLTFNENC